jgi:uncharacterized protein (DUF1501 family)
MRQNTPTRRTFLGQSAALLAAPAVPALFDQSLHTGSTGAADDNVLVVVQLTGGNDGLNTVVPFIDDDYHRLRPGLRLEAGGVHKLTDTVGLHPNLRPLLDPYGRGEMVVIQGVGYPGHDRSHFRAADAWHSARPEYPDPSSGWIGRYLDRASGGIRGASLGGVTPLAMRGERCMPLELSHPRGELRAGLRVVASAIREGSPARVYFVQLGGFDTHSNQRARHGRLMRDFGEAVGAFRADLAAQGNADRVMMLAFSEFGRAVAENAAGGTDHGSAGPVLLFGPHVNGGVYGTAPSLTDLDAGGLRHHVDFRSVYATVLERWLAAPSAPILGRRFDLLPVVKS